MDVNWAAIRADFPALSARTYLNTATFGQIPARAVGAVAAHFARRDRLACADYIQWFDDADGIREAIGVLINCPADDIAFVPNASSALSLLLGGLDWQPGDRVVTLQDEFPNHYYYAWRLKSRGVEFVETPFAGFYDAITPQTRVVTLSTVNYSTGFRAPMAEIAAFLRERNVLLYVDGTQSVGALRFDVAAVQPDMFAVDGYKWLLAPNGAAFFYISPELRRSLDPAVIGWRSHKDWRQTDHLHHGEPEFPDRAEMYEGGMLPFAALYGLQASIDLMLEIGPELIEQRVMDLAAKTAEALRRAGGQVAHCESPIVTARFSRDAAELAESLAERGILVAARHGNLRVSPHFYNNEEDIGELERALAG
ncbi:MAG TPA: aminotransferase class V-fold PLP-dependent enzyme [Bryobacteraceae bacterium]|nr:aminotransferase class V-fold PLP-dependent enzyme [Bryobacteraceae bacterium]